MNTFYNYIPRGLQLYDDLEDGIIHSKMEQG
jgi:hypothetical protein